MRTRRDDHPVLSSAGDDPRNDPQRPPVSRLCDELEQAAARGGGSGSAEAAAAQCLRAAELQHEIDRREVANARRALHAAHSRYLGLYDFAPIALVALKPGGSLLECNLAAAAMLGMDRPLVIGMPFVHCLHRASVRDFLNHLRSCRKDGSCVTELLLRRGPDTSALPVQMYSVATARTPDHPVEDAADGRSGEDLTIRSAILDISERKRHEAELRQAREELEARVLERTRRLETVNWELREKVSECQVLENELMERMRQLAAADRSKDQFLAMLAHELRNPLAPLQNAMYLMADGRLPVQQQRGLHEMIQRQMDQLVRIVDDLLEVTRFTQGKVQLHTGTVDIAEILDAAAESTAHMVAQRNHRFERVAPEEPLRVEGDKVRLVQALVNLLNNASKYTDQGGKVSLLACREHDQAVIRVRDNGVGIQPEMLERIFDLFAQAPRTLDRSQGGLGIGLTLVKTVIEMHRGKVSAHSEGIGSGSEFKISLPLVHVDPAAPAGRKHVQHACKRVLVVDDNRDSAESLVALVQHWGHEARSAFEGRRAVAMAADFRPQIVFLDIGLPGLDGYAVVQELRSDPGLRDAVIVAVTGYGQEADRERTKLAGFNMHLVKPVCPEVLEELLAQ